MKRETYEQYKNIALDYFCRAGITITAEECGRIEVADFGLNDIERTGLQLLTYVNTERCCAKEIVLAPHQTCPEHRHPEVAGEPGKEETFRCRYGKVYLYTDGYPTGNNQAQPPAGDERWYGAAHEVILYTGEQYTLAPDTLHWFQAGPEGAVVSEFSTCSRDEADIFTDERIVRLPVIED